MGAYGLGFGLEVAVPLRALPIDLGSEVISASESGVRLLHRGQDVQDVQDTLSAVLAVGTATSRGSRPAGVQSRCTGGLDACEGLVPGDAGGARQLASPVSRIR
ncbi:hypothetical protein ACWDZ6_16220 [Streptomyces sp. NPDC002926]